ncbi:SbcC/MukB-like Walker B domain-containing protein [Nocardia fluminea]|uniref:SbcC/MukB-like Walker B domain-containing protein n=1 Tax=Nocardia fluminea TaxID=134984 RepID=UPI0033F3A097
MSKNTFHDSVQLEVRAVAEGRESPIDTPVSHGVPGGTGRWQPTRAGVVNSWKWTDEEFRFADGWLAFVGRNGSGKSLTASQLITVLLDGDTSQTALGVSGRASGTLLSRHTDNRDKEDKTGVWWLEFGRTDPVTGRTEFVSVGLWLRSSGQSLLRAFFLATARVGEELVLQTDRNPVDIGGLAEQLSCCEGELFTDSPRLKPKAAAHLNAIGPESGYRAAVRTRLFAPLDELQYDALLSVLRTLRSVRTAEKISARDMLEVLTGAMPALDQAKLSDIASAMQRIATLERELADTREQSKKLEATDRVYELYRRAVTLTTAAELRAANAELERLSRLQKSAESELDESRSITTTQREALAQARIEVSQLEGKVLGAEAALRDHAGAELPLHEKRAEDLKATAESEEEHAAEGLRDAAAARTAAETAESAAIEAQQSLANAVRELSRTGASVDADGVLTKLASTAVAVTRQDQLHSDVSPLDLDIDELAATPHAWVEMRRHNVSDAQIALAGMDAANQAAIGAAAEHRAAVEEAERRAAALTDSASARSSVEQQLEAAIIEWQKLSEFFAPVPEAVLEADQIDGRVDPHRISRWLDQEVAAIRDRLDVPGLRIRRESADSAANQATAFAAEQREAAVDAATEAERVQGRYDEQCQRDAIKDAEDADIERAAENEHDRLVDTAHEQRNLALSDQLDRTEAALRAIDRWTDGIRHWRSGLHHLDGTGIVAPQLSNGGAQQLISTLSAARAAAGGGRLDRTTPAVTVADQLLATLAGYDPEPLRSALATESQRTLARLDRNIVEAERTAAESRKRVEKTVAELAEARRAPLPPQQPDWRTRTDGSPLWSLVDFREDVPADTRNRCEGALLVAGILDAVVTADGRARVGDTVLTGTVAANGPSAADLLTVEPDSPIGAARTLALLRSISVEDSPSGTTVRTGVLTATAPADYVCRYIGTTARERDRAERVALLAAQLEQDNAELNAAELDLNQRTTALAEATAEVDAVPSPGLWQAARAEAHAAQRAAQDADRMATQRQANAAAELRSVRDRLAAARQARATALAEIDSELNKTRALARQAEAAAAAATDKAEEAANTAVLVAARLETAIAAQSRADHERQKFPSLEALFAAIAEEDDATQLSTAAGAEVVKTAEDVRKAQGTSERALDALNRAVNLGNGRTLPTEPTALRSFSGSLDQLLDQVHSWKRSMDRAVDLCAGARSTTAISIERHKRAERLVQQADAARADAITAAEHVREQRELYGVEYANLMERKTQAANDLAAVKGNAEDIRSRIQQAEIVAAGARSTLANIAPQREQAESGRERCVRQMSRLVDESIAVVDNGIVVDEAGRPANLTAALTWSARILATEGRSYQREELAKLLETRRSRLEAEAKKTSSELVRFDRQITLQTIHETDWRRAVVAAPEALLGEDLHETVTELRQTAEQLERDLRDDVKETLKTSMFTALRREIATRREAARELVRQIRATLGGVRTGVARVGVEVDWKVKRDPDAQKMIELVSALPSDETFQQMYDVLHQRLEEATGDTWEARVAHTFDYRAWHEWDIKVTHASFGDGTTEVFRPLTTRSNPLASFSTGEMRLATMLPLLAAAWSMYETPGYHGPRLLFVDEVNAAFDPQNVRKLLALLRTWRFDVLSTAPEMSAMLKAEAERVMIVQVTQSGDVGVAVSWLWTGSGQPVLLMDGAGRGAGAA